MKKSNYIKTLSALTIAFTLISCGEKPVESVKPSVEPSVTPSVVESVEPSVVESAESSVVESAESSAVESESVHTHTFASEYSKDETYHWLAATCGHDDAVTKEEHKWNDGVVQTEATEEAEGLKVYTCEVCGQTKNEVIAKKEHVHTFATEYSKDDIGHWFAATCGHDDAVTKEEHKWGTPVASDPDHNLYTNTYTCEVCGQTKVETIDNRDYEDDAWTAVGAEKVYFFEDDAIYSVNEENIGDGIEHFIFANHDYLINNTSLGANYTVSVDLKGTYETSVDCEIDAGLVAYYVDESNYVVIGVKWANWDRPHEIRSIFVSGLINGTETKADIWTDNCGSLPIDGATLTVTKTGKKFDIALTNCYGGWSKTGNISVDGTDTTEAKVGLYAANDTIQFKNFAASNIEVATAVSYKATIEGASQTLTLESKDNTFTLVNGATSESGSYTANGRNVTLTYANGDVKYVKVYDNNGSFEFYTPAKADDDALVIDGSSSKQVSVVKENYVGDYTMTFDYLGTLTESGHAVKVGFDAWYVDDNNYITVYIEWNATDRSHEIRCVEVTGKVGGSDVGWNDIWCDGSNVLVSDGGKLTVTKTGNTFAIKLVSGTFSKEDSKTISQLTDLDTAYSTRLYAEGDKVSFSNVEMYKDLSANYDVSGTGAESAVLRDTGIVLNNATAIQKTAISGDYSVSFDYVGTLTESGHAVKVGFDAWYVDENNYITVYVEWSASERSHEIRCVEITGYIDGTHVGWNDNWCDGSNILVSDGGKLTVTKTGNVFSMSFSNVAGTFTKEGAATIASLDTTKEFKVGFYSEGDTVTFKNIVVAYA